MRLCDHRRCAPTAIILLLAASCAIAQRRIVPPVVLGLGGGYDIASGALVKSSNIDEVLEQRTRIRMAHLAFIFPKLFMDGWGLSPTLCYGDLDLAASATRTRAVFVTGAPTDGKTTVDYTLFMRVAMLELMTAVRIAPSVRLDVGPIGGVGFFPEYTENERIISPGGATFLDGTTERSESAAPVDEGLFIAGFGLRIGYEIPFFGGLALMPSVNLRGLASIDGNGDGVAVGGSAGLALSLLTSRTAGEPVDAPAVGIVDTVRIVDSVATRSTLRADVDLYSVDSVGRRADTLVVAMRRTMRRVEVPLRTTVLFAPSSAAMPATSVESAEQASRFAEEDLVAMSPLEIRRQSLEIIAARIRADRSLRVALVGSRSAGEPAWFAEARARSVREYLARTWSIDSTRVTISASRAAATAASVELRFTGREVAALAPVVSEWIDQEIDAPSIGVQPTIVARVGVQRWRVSVMQGEREIGVVRNTDEPDARRLDIGLAMRRLSHDEARRALGAELVVEDSAGAVAVARDRMEVIVDTVRAARGAAAETVVGEYLVPAGDTLASAPVLRRIVEALPVDARVTVSAPLESGAAADRLAARLRTIARASGRTIAELSTERASIDGASIEGGEVDRDLVLVRVHGAMP
jgi:hypothetical protein